MRIKKFTLMTLALLVSMVSFAQKAHFDHSAMVSKVVRNQKTSESLSVISFEGKTPAKFKISHRAEVVTPPAGDPAYYKLSGYHSRSKAQIERTVKVIWDDDDVYISGFSYFCPEAYVKGTFTNENTVVFSANQFLGTHSFSDGDAELYFAGTTTGSDMTDVTATYAVDDQTGTDQFTFTGFVGEFYSMGGSTGLTAYWRNPTLTLLAEEDIEIPVEAPSDLESKLYSYSAMDGFSDSDVSWNVTVGFYGNEVYIQGLSTRLPEAWVKGSYDDANGIVTIPNQLLGSYNNNNLYFVAYSSGLADGYILNYDKTTGNFTEGDYSYMVNLYKDKIDHSVYEYYGDVNIKSIIEKAATPANPSINYIRFAPNADMLEMNINVNDVDGEGLLPSKLYYKIYSKDALGNPTAVDFTKDLYTELESDLQELPYELSTKNIKNSGVNLLMDHADWTEIGVQSIYKGGDETHESEIVWYTIQWPIKTTLPDGLKVTSHDFKGTQLENGSPVSFTSSLYMAIDNNDLYIQGLGADAGVSDTWIKGTKNEAGEYVFKAGQDLGSTTSYRLFWLGYNSTDGIVEDFKLTVDKENGVYKFANAGLLNVFYVEHSYYYSRYTEDCTIDMEGYTDDPVVAPAGLVTDEYSYKGLDYFAEEGDDPNVTKNVKIGFDGNDVYLQGIGAPSYLPEAWIKGKLEGNKITFRTGQCLGTRGNSTLWFRSLAADLSSFENAVFTYDETTGTLTTANYLSVAKNKAEKSGNYIIDYNVTITKIADKAATPAKPEFENLHFTPAGNFIGFTIKTVDIEGEGLLTDKLYYKFYSKGENGEPQEVTFTTELYKKLTNDMTEIPYGFVDAEGGYDFGTDFVYLNMDFSAWKEIGLQAIYKGGNATNASEIAWYTVVYPYNVSLPSGVEPTTHAFTGTQGSAGTPFSKTVKLAKVDNDLYIQGLYEEAWIKGSLTAENTYTFGNGQLLGVYGTKYMLFLLGTDALTAPINVVNPVIVYNATNDQYEFVTNFLVNATYTDRSYFLDRFNIGSVINATPTGIDTVKADTKFNADAPAYNMAGQRVNNSFKGMIIKDGQKFMNK